MRHDTRRRLGFTLIELLVVISIIALLAALTIAFFPTISSQASEANGAASLQGWFNMARQKAVRNQNPYGVRLWVKDSTTMWVTECNFIEQPDDLIAGTASTASDGATIVTINNNPPMDLYGGSGAGDSTLWLVQPGDYLEILGTGLMHRIVGIPSSTTLAVETPIPFQLYTPPFPPPYPSYPTNYRVLRAARVVGEEVLALPPGVVVDLATNTTYNNALPFNKLPTGGYVDVLFSPSGAVLTPGAGLNTMNFWVRLPDSNTPTNEFAGAPTIIAVWNQTGLVGAYAPVPLSSEPTPYYDVK